MKYKRAYLESTVVERVEAFKRPGESLNTAVKRILLYAELHGKPDDLKLALRAIGD